MRTIRHNAPGVVYHLISRFVDRDWFFKDDEERAFYLYLLGRALVESDWRCLAFALMSNHIHLAMLAGRASLASWAKRVNGPFASWMNARHHRIGPMFVRGPKDFAIVPENEGQLIAYVHNNPVRAGVVPDARQSTWTSHPAYVGHVLPPRWLHVTEGLARAGFDDRARFDEWVNATPGDSGKVNVERVRRAVAKRGAIELGTPTGGEVAVVPFIARPHAHVRPDPRRIVQITADILGMSEVELCSRRRSAIVVAGRRIATRCAKALGISGSDVAAALAITPQAVSRMRGPDAELNLASDQVLERLRWEIGP